MSGEPVTGMPVPAWPPTHRYGARTVAIANDRKGVVERSVASLAELAELPEPLPRAALVGGLAVMVRLYEAHRVTTDFDEVTDGREQTIAVLVERGAERTANGVRFVDRGVQLDLLDAELSLRDLDELAAGLSVAEITDPERRALQFALVNRYALDTAVPTRIVVLDPRRADSADSADREDGGVVAEVAMPVALAGALVAMKAHAAVQPERKPPKAAGDAYDAYRLIRAWGPSVIAEDLSRAPVALLARTVAQLRSVFVEDADRTVRRLRSASVPGVEAVSLDDLDDAAEVIAAIEPFLHWDDAGVAEPSRVTRP